MAGPRIPGYPKTTTTTTSIPRSSRGSGPSIPRRRIPMSTTTTTMPGQPRTAVTLAPYEIPPATAVTLPPDWAASTTVPTTTLVPITSIAPTTTIARAPSGAGPTIPARRSAAGPAIPQTPRAATVGTEIRTSSGPRVVPVVIDTATGYPINANPQRVAMELGGGRPSYLPDVAYPSYTPTAEDKAWGAEAAARAAALTPQQLAAAGDSGGFLPDSYQAANMPGQWNNSTNPEFRTSPQIDAMLTNLITDMAKRGLRQNMAGRQLASDGMPFGPRTLEQSIGFGYRPWDPLAGLTPAQRTQGNLDFLRSLAMEEGGYTPPTGAGAW